LPLSDATCEVGSVAQTTTGAAFPPVVALVAAELETLCDEDVVVVAGEPTSWLAAAGAAVVGPPVAVPEELTAAEPAAAEVATLLGDAAAVPAADVTPAVEDAAALVPDPLEQPAVSKPSATTVAPAMSCFIRILRGCVRGPRRCVNESTISA
jgi:hypothetical protein